MLTHQNEAELREVHFLPEDYKHNSSLLIFGNKLAFFSSAKELVTIIIESTELAESERKKFDLLWALLDTAPKEEGI